MTATLIASFLPYWTPPEIKIEGNTVSHPDYPHITYGFSASNMVIRDSVIEVRDGAGLLECIYRIK